MGEKMAMKEATKQKRLTKLNGEITGIKKQIEKEKTYLEDWDTDVQNDIESGNSWMTSADWEGIARGVKQKSKRKTEILCKNLGDAIEKRDKFVIEHMTETACIL